MILHLDSYRWKMLANTRLAARFALIGDCARRYGVFAKCGGGLRFAAVTAAEAMAGCC